MNAHDPAEDFVDDVGFHSLLAQQTADTAAMRDVLAKSMAKQPLSPAECAVLLAADQPEQVDEIQEAARELKRQVYGNRIVLFAPLYIGNLCVNDCLYCAFRRSLRTTVRKTLTEDELTEQVLALEDAGHKRLILVFGEHPRYSPEFIADTVRKVYSIRHDRGEIRRVNINAAPMDIDGYKQVKAAGIGTYQVFQETYHRETYARFHPPTTRKSDLHVPPARLVPRLRSGVRRRRDRRPVRPVRLAV